MSKYLKLSIPSSCEQHWNEMVVEAGGRYCLSCQKSVVDFTMMTDAELISYFKKYKDPTCGRFRQSQLERAIPFSKKPVPWLKYFFRFTMPAFLLSLKSAAHAQKIIAPIGISPVTPKPGAPNNSRDTTPLRGIVTDEAGAPLPWVSIMVKGTNKGTATDTNGHFTLKEVDVPATLIVSYVGYQSKEVRVTSHNVGTEIRMGLSQQILGLVAVSYRVPKKIKRKEHPKHTTEAEVPTETPSMLPYPNPITSGSRLNIQCHALEKGTYSVEIYALSGQLVQRSTVAYGPEDGAISLSLGPLTPGNYILQLIHRTSGKHLSEHIVIQN